MFLLPIVGYTLLVFIEFIPLYKKRPRREFWVTTGFGVLSLAIAILLSFGIKIPSPEKPIRELITMLFGK